MTPSDPIVRRLAMLASVFSKPSRSFLAACRGRHVEIAVDLGCGTGHTTRLVATQLQPGRTVGLDRSSAALQAARYRTRNPGVRFLEHDVTATPFPGETRNGGGGPDLVYGRFLLAHVPSPLEVAARWIGELPPGGRLLLDEGTGIQTTHEPIGRYLEIVGALQQHRGAAVDIGEVLDAIAGLPGVGAGLSRRITFAPPAREVAAMFRANIDAWRDDPFITTHVGEVAVDWVERELEALARSPMWEGVTWDLRQIVLERR
jgi:SAM-dependent methyltransferase